MRKTIFLITFSILVFSFLKFFLNSTPEDGAELNYFTLDGSISNSPTSNSPTTERAPNSGQNDENLKPNIVIDGPLPQNVPTEITSRLKHIKSYEDESYIETQLSLDGRPLEDYYFKWKKNARGSQDEIISGAMPRIDSIKGNFPSEKEILSLVETTAERNTEILSIKEVWSLSNQRVLFPTAKVQVQTQARNERSNGHEIWFINLNTGKIVKRVEADRN